MPFSDWLPQSRSLKDGMSWRMMLITVPWVVGIIFAIASVRHNEQVAGREQQTIGVITSHETGNHNQYRYSFSVAGQVFRGLSQSPNENTAIGDHQRVFFDPRDPDTNSLQDFGKGQSMLGLITLAGTGTIGMACLILFSKWKARRSTLTN